MMTIKTNGLSSSAVAVVQGQTVMVVIFVSTMGQISPKRDRSGTFSVSQNVLKADLKKAPITNLSDVYLIWHIFGSNLISMQTVECVLRQDKEYVAFM